MADISAERKRQYQRRYWLKKAWVLGILTTGREDDAAKEAEKLYRRDYRKRMRNAES